MIVLSFLHSQRPDKPVFKPLFQDLLGAWSREGGKGGFSVS